MRSRASQALADIDGDGDLDAFVGERFGNTFFFENVPEPAGPMSLFSGIMAVAALARRRPSRGSSGVSFIAVGAPPDLDLDIKPRSATRIRIPFPLERAVMVFAFVALAASSALADGGRGRGPRHAIFESALQGVHGTSPDVTLRMVARASISGTDLRVRLGNQYGKQPVRIASASIAVQWAVKQPAAVPGSLRQLTFRRMPSVEIAPGAVVTSDPVDLRVAAQQNLLVSVYAPGAFYPAVGGDLTLDEAGEGFPANEVFEQDLTPGWHPGLLLSLDLVDAKTHAKGTIVALGASITDGFEVSGGGDRWMDLLAQEIQLLPPRARKSIVNAGISGNTVSRQPNPYDATGQCCGAPAPVRLDLDVLAVPGVTDVILLEGTNDLGGDGAWPPSPASQVIDGMREIVQRVRARGLRIIGATVLPMCNDPGSEQEANRLAGNAFIRTSGIFYGVVDWDAVMRDPGDPTVIRPEWKDDCYHPNAAGNRVMARAFDLTLLGLCVGGGHGD